MKVKVVKLQNVQTHKKRGGFKGDLGFEVHVVYISSDIKSCLMVAARGRRESGCVTSVFHLTLSHL